MLTKDAIAHFGNQNKLAEALGISRSAGGQWGEVVPEAKAYRLERITGGDLSVDESLYQKRA